MFELGPKWEEDWSIEKEDKTVAKLPKNHNLNVSIQKRRGKVVTVIEPFFLKKGDLKSLLKELKTSLASGGAIKENSLEIQGEHIQKVKEFLKTKGFKFKS